MPTAEASTKVNNSTTKGAPATKQTLRFPIKYMSIGYDFPDISRDNLDTIKKLCHIYVTHKYSQLKK